MGDLHSLKIMQTENKLDGCKIELDGFVLKGVSEYAVKSSDLGGAELTVKFMIGNLELLID